MNKTFKKPPFELDRSRCGTLVEQLSAALQQAIETGYYRAGDMLPPTRDLASFLGVSRVVAIRAMRRLADRRLINPRPHAGSIVCSRKRPLWKGQVLIVVPPDAGNTPDNTASAVIRDTFTANGYLAQAVTVSRTEQGKFDFALLDIMLRQQTDLVVLLHDQEAIAHWLSMRGVPFIRRTTDNRNGQLPRGCVGVIRDNYDSANAAFAAHCRENCVDEVTVVSAWNSDSVVGALNAEGVPVTLWRVEMPAGASGSVVSQRALAAMKARLDKRPNMPFPKMLFFDDDYLASGALTMMLWAGIRIPEDVRVVTLTNSSCGSGLAFPVSFTRIEVDPIACGRAIAETILKYLATGTFPLDATIGPTYVKGETF